MSQAALQWAWDQRCGSMAAKATLRFMAYLADDRGVCFPSIDTICSSVECNGLTARKTVQILEERGLIERVRRDGPGFDRNNQTPTFRLLMKEARS